MQVFPGDLLEHTYPDPDNPDRLVGRSEVERREVYFEQLMPKLPDVIKHPLVMMVKECLRNAASRRPTAEQLVTTLEGMKADIEGPYGEFVKVDAIRHVMTTRAIKQRDVKVRAITGEVNLKDDEIQQLQQALVSSPPFFFGTLLLQKYVLRQKKDGYIVLQCFRLWPGEDAGFRRVGANYYSIVCTHCLLYTSPSPRDATLSRMPSSA